jgi:hypothetical protein
MKASLPQALIVIIVCLGLAIGLEAADKWVKVNGGSWEPSPKMLVDLKAQIESYVKSQVKAQGRELKRWEDYTFQYQGREEKGRKFIFINALCIQSDSPRLDKEIIVILDGGSCFFNLKFDPDRNEFFELFINGEA